MKCGRHSSIRKWLRLLLPALLISAGWPLATGAKAEAEESRAVGLCCAWGSRLKDGVLTFSVKGDDPTALSILRSAVQQWDEALADLTLEEVAPDARKRSQRADIVMVYGPGAADGGESHPATGAQGLTTTYLNGRRMITRVEIGVDGGPSPIHAGAVEQITKHEIGHALGLGHANWDDDLMSPLVQPTPAPVPSCDIDAVRRANSWKMVDNAKRPKPAPSTESPC